MKNAVRLWIVLTAALLGTAWLLAGAGQEETPVPDDAPQQASSPDARTLRVLLGGEVRELRMDDYLVGVLRAEMPASFESAALQAQAVAARTYTLYRMAAPSAAHPDADACDDPACCKAYCSAQQAADGWGERAEEYEQKLRAAVTDTAGQILTYEDQPILAVFFSSAAGQTQSSGAVWQEDLPYLQSVSSPEDESLVPNYYSAVTLRADDVRSTILSAYPAAALPDDGSPIFTALERDAAGYVTCAQLGGLTLRGNDVRTLLGLRSPCFTVEESDGALTFRVTGYGHGVGMSQYGANALAKQGFTCGQILAHYYPGTVIALDAGG